MDEAKIQSGEKSKCCNANTILHVTTGTHAAGTRVCGRCGKVVPPSPTPALTLEEELKEHTDTTVQEAMYVLQKRGAFKTAQEVDDFFKSTLKMSLHERDAIHAKHHENNVSVDIDEKMSTKTLEEELKEHDEELKNEDPNLDEYFTLDDVLEVLHERDAIHAKHHAQAQQRIEELEGALRSVNKESAANGGFISIKLAFQIKDLLQKHTS